MEKCCTWDNGSVLHKDQPHKIYVGQWPIFHGPLILHFIIVIDLNYFNTLRNGTGHGVFMLLRALALVSVSLQEFWQNFPRSFVELSSTKHKNFVQITHFDFLPWLKCWIRCFKLFTRVSHCGPRASGYNLVLTENMGTSNFLEGYHHKVFPQPSVM